MNRCEVESTMKFLLNWVHERNVTRTLRHVKVCPKGFLRLLRNNRSYSGEFGGKTNTGGKWYDAQQVDHMPRKELQKWCKKLGIRANTKSLQMREDLVNFHRDVLSKSDILQYPFVPMYNSTNHHPGYYQGSTPLNKTCLSAAWNFNNPTIDHVTGSHKQVRHFKNTITPTDENWLEYAMLYTEEIVSLGLAEGHRIPSVSKILRSTAPKSKLFAITNWTKKQKELLGEDVFRRKMNEIKKRGTEFHNFIHRCLTTGKLNTEIPVGLKGYFKSTEKVFEKLNGTIASEKAIRHPHLGYQGKLDTLAFYHEDPCIIEWKTSQRRKAMLEDCGEYPMQMVAYAGAINADKTNGIQIRNGVLVIAYEDGSPADVHLLDLYQCRNFWQDWLVRLHKFQTI